MYNTIYLVYALYYGQCALILCNADTLALQYITTDTLVMDYCYPYGVDTAVGFQLVVVSIGGSRWLGLHLLGLLGVAVQASKYHAWKYLRRMTCKACQLWGTYVSLVYYHYCCLLVEWFPLVVFYGVSIPHFSIGLYTTISSCLFEFSIGYIKLYHIYLHYHYYYDILYIG